jgi:V/A-type H+-transporting ATPase subunit D
MEQVSATRSELLARRARIGLASQGRDLLKERRSALVHGEVEVDVSTRNVAGVPIVEIETAPVARARTARGYSLTATSARIDAVADRFEAVLEKLLDVAALELSIRRLAEEIARTTRRMNALEHVVLPALEAERAHIALVLEEREMEDRVRLRRARASRSRRV